MNQKASAFGQNPQQPTSRGTPPDEATPILSLRGVGTIGTVSLQSLAVSANLASVLPTSVRANDSVNVCAPRILARQNRASQMSVGPSTIGAIPSAPQSALFTTYEQPENAVDYQESARRLM